MRRYLFVLTLAILSFSLGFWAQHASAGQPNDPPQAALSDQDMTPSQLHQMLAEMKQERLDALRRAGIDAPVKGTAAQSYYDARYYRLNLNLDDTTEIISGWVYLYAEAKINGFNVLELNFFDNPDMYIDSIKSEDVSLSYTWIDNIIRIFLSGTYDAGEAFGVTVYYHGHPLEGGLQSFDWGYHGSPSMPIMCTLSCPYFSQSWWPCKDLPRDKADSADVSVTLRSDLYLVSNGLLEEVVDHGSTKTFKWHEGYPIATYLIFISATNYSIFSNWYESLSGDSMQVIYHAYPERLSQALAYWQITPSIIDFYANLFGEYPWSTRPAPACTATDSPNTW
jgi:aminopeptidase N